MAKNDPPSSIVAYITSITGGFLTFFMIFGGVIIFMKMVSMSFLMKMSIFIKNGPGDDFRLMTRVLPRPLVLQGGKSFEIQTQNS